MTDDRSGESTRSDHVDVIVIGAGFAGLYMLHKLRELGFSARVLEMGDGVGGTWFWNRYPGARCDVESIEYSYSFSPEIEQEWVWTELMPPQPEIERYLNYVADKLDLRVDIQLETKVTALEFDEDACTWTVTCDTGDQFTSRFVVAATGCLSAPLEPDIPGLDTFEGVSLFTNRFPKEGYDFTGQRVAVIGTGSSGVQSIPVIAEQAAHLTVLQRSAAYTMPAGNRPLAPGELETLKAGYADIRERQHRSFAGALRFAGVSLEEEPPTRKILDTPMEERMAALDEHGWHGVRGWADVMLDMRANEAATELYAELVRREVNDPETAAALVPHYPFGCKRGIIDTGYFETFNRDNVELVDLRKGGIEEITPTGIRTAQEHIDVDVIVYATGFDAMTGALNRIDIRGRDGARLREVWDTEGPCTYLGLQVHGFPNLFTITGPLSPSVASNMVVSIEQHVDWIAGCLTYMRDRGYETVEATAEAQEAWVEHATSLMAGSIATSDSCNSWYVGANVPGKRRFYMPYAGGVPYYRQKCEAVVAADYEGFAFAN